MSDLFSVVGKIACVTGASSGLGQMAATLLLNSGAKVIAVARRSDRLKEWAAQNGNAAAIICADLSDRDHLHDVIEQIKAPFGAPDILINAAGVNIRDHADDVTAQSWDMTLNLNLAAPFFLAQGLVPAMRKAGWGRILNFASLQSRRAFDNGLSYGASKGGVEQMTRAMAQAWSRDGITANAIAPGFFETELTQAVFANQDLAAKNAVQTCIGRNGVPSDLHGTVLFFCSKASDYITGQTLFVDGGFSAK